MKKEIYYRENRWIYLGYLVLIVIIYFINERSLFVIGLLLFLVLFMVLNESKPKKDAQDNKEEKKE